MKLVRYRKHILFLWGTILITFGLWLWNYPQYRDLHVIAEMIRSYGCWSLGVYGCIFFFRWVLLVPSTPLIIIGILLFPDNLLLVFAISMTSILFSSGLIYGFSDILGLDDYFAGHVKSEKIKKAIERYGFFAITFWSFFLVLPTDLICYIAGAVRYHFGKFLSAVALGEGFIVGLFIYGGGDILHGLIDLAGKLL